jgi:hypothetical protein
MNKINDELHPVFIKIPPDQIVLLKCLIESYEGIAEIRTLDKDIAIVVILAMKDTVEIVFSILENEQSLLRSELIEEPVDVTEGDWLLSTLKDQTSLS